MSLADVINIFGINRPSDKRVFTVNDFSEECKIDLNFFAYEDLSGYEIKALQKMLVEKLQQKVDNQVFEDEGVSLHLDVTFFPRRITKVLSNEHREKLHYEVNCKLNKISMSKEYREKILPEIETKEKFLDI